MYDKGEHQRIHECKLTTYLCREKNLCNKYTYIKFDDLVVED